MTNLDADVAPSEARTVVLAHIEAFNAHDTEQLMAGFAADAVWATGQDVAHGHAELAEVFDAWLWTLDPRLTVRTLAADASVVAAELREEFTVKGERRAMNIAVFFEIRNGQILTAKVYREGAADVG
jgi:uncharacterized protein